MGWVNEIAPAGTVLDVAIDWAEQVAAMAPGAVRRFKRARPARRLGRCPPDEALALGHRHARELMGMRDTVEGATAFAEKRERRVPRRSPR
ncbi:MAG: hypothetical protein U5R31_03320 [Acidimicrobiia bacterium]|nr:hypothetical protein [Acidimicrobiia bacterium]